MIRVLANGVFDILHEGHVEQLRLGKSLGDELWVAVTRDRSVNKGLSRPVRNEAARLSLIRELRCVDHAFLVDSSYEALIAVMPSIFIKGNEYQGKIREEDLEFCADFKCRIIFTADIDSSTKILNDLARRG